MNRRTEWLTMAGWLAVATALRLANFPGPHELRDEDEIRYATAGLQLFEGLPPGMKATPNGPQTWLGAAYAAYQTVRTFVAPPAEWGSTPAQVRFFLAADRTLFDAYRDVSGLRAFLLAWQMVLALAAVAAACWFGFSVAGLAGGVLLGGFVACLPMYVEYAAMTRAYSDAWSFAWIAIGLFAWPESRGAAVGRAVAFGLAVASRIDMVLLAPVMVLLHDRLCEPGRPRWRRAVRFALGSAAVAYLAAPWTLVHFVGLLRVIATARVVGQFTSDNPRLDTLAELTWSLGLGPLLAWLAVLVVLTARRATWTDRSLVVFAAALGVSMWAGPYQPMRYHGAVLIALAVAAGVLTGRLPDRALRPAAVIGLAVVALPLGQSVAGVQRTSRQRTDANVVGWVEAHVPPGSIVYLFSQFEAEAVLPTVEASGRLWAEVTDDAAWRRKFQRGLGRFRLDAQWLPRAFSEENLWLERADRRRWFALGSGVDATRPRFDVRVFLGSPTFGVQDVLAESRRTGGFIIFRGGRPPADAGAVRREWLARDGTGVFVLEAAPPAGPPRP
jgi:hypothetical protein